MFAGIICSKPSFKRAGLELIPPPQRNLEGADALSNKPWLLFSCRVGDAQRLLEPLRKPGLKSMTWIFLSGLMGFILPNNTRNPGPSVTLCFSLQVQLMFQEIPLLHKVFPALSP